MYVKRSSGPRQVSLPDGSILTRADLPPPDTQRWVASRKALVVAAVVHGLMTEEEVLELYALSSEEFSLWRRAVETHGKKALQVTSIQKYRKS